MPSFEQGLTETERSTSVEGGNTLGSHGVSEPTELIMGQRTPASAAARMLELAAVTADTLVTDARNEAESLVTGARARADAILEESRTEADQVAAGLARIKREQAADLDLERASARAELGEEKADLEAQIATLREMERLHRSHMRQQLTEHLSMLDATLPEPPAGFDG